MGHPGHCHLLYVFFHNHNNLGDTGSLVVALCLILAKKAEKQVFFCYFKAGTWDSEKKDP